ncbi:hypothetical protein BGX34_007403, partial [Mortierella sp. NVP85]
IVPFRIKHHPGVVLDVVLSSSDENTSATVAATDRDREDTASTLQVTGLSADPSSSITINNSSYDRAFTLSGSSAPPPLMSAHHSSFKRGSRNPLSFKQIMRLSKMTPMELKIEQQLVSALPSDLQVQVLTSTNTQESSLQVVQEGTQMYQQHEQLIASLRNLDDRTMNIESMASKPMELATRNIELTCKSNELASENKDLLIRVNEMQDELKQLQIQALDRRVLLQKS